MIVGYQPQVIYTAVGLGDWPRGKQPLYRWTTQAWDTRNESILFQNPEPNGRMEAIHIMLLVYKVKKLRLVPGTPLYPIYSVSTILYRALKPYE